VHIAHQILFELQQIQKVTFVNHEESFFGFATPSTNIHYVFPSGINRRKTHGQQFHADYKLAISCS